MTVPLEIIKLKTIGNNLKNVFYLISYRNVLITIPWDKLKFCRGDINIITKFILYIILRIIF